MKGMILRCLLVITLVLGIIVSACPVLGQEALWSSYHYDMYRSGQNRNSKDIKDPSTIKAIWAFPRADADSGAVDEALRVVDDSDTAFSATGRWRLIDQVSDPLFNNDAVNKTYHVTDVVISSGTPPANVALAYWPFPSIPEGRYQVFIWVPEHSAATTTAVYSVTDDYGTRSFTFNQYSNSGTWAPLTNNFFTFTGRMANQGVKLTALQENPVLGHDKVLADAIKFVPVPNREIYSSPVSANIPCTLTDPTKPSDVIFDDLGTCVYVGAVESETLATQEAGHDTGAIYCIYGVTPTTANPRQPGTVDTPNPNVPDSERLMKISKYLGKPKWRYPRNGPDVNSREKTEGPIEGGVYSSPTLATIAGSSGNPNRLVCFATGMDRQMYALDAVTGELLWKGPGHTVGEEDDPAGLNGWTPAASREDAFGGKFHYIACAGSSGTPTKCTWNFDSADQQNGRPIGADGLSYSIYAWLPEAGGTGTLRRSNDATYVIKYYDPSAQNNQGEATIHVDQANSASFGTWVKLGSSYFNPTSVELLNTATPIPDPDSTAPPGSDAADFAVIADAIMFVPDTIEGMGYSTPITDADTVANPTTALATSVFTVTETGRALAFDLTAMPGNKVGKLKWVYPAIRTEEKPTPDQVDQPDLGAMSASPAYADDRLYIAGMNGTVTCIRGVKGSTPSLDWSFRSDSDPDGLPAGFNSSPALDGTNVYLASTGGHIYCLDMKGAKKDSEGNIEPVWEYPSKVSDANPLGAFRYSTPAIAVSRGVKRLWCAGSDGRIYSFKANDGTRLFTDDNGDFHGAPPSYDEPSFGLPVQGSIALDEESAAGNIIMYVGDMGDRSGTLHWRDAHTGLVPNDATGVTGLYEGWTAPGVMFSSPNLTKINVDSTDVSMIFVGCGDGHLIAFSRAGGAWGGEWQGGDWPFEGDMDTQGDQRSSSAPVTDVQFDVFNESFFNASLNWNPEPDKTTFNPSNWQPNVIVSLDMKVPNPNDALIKSGSDTDRDTYLTNEAKKRRSQENLAASRLTGATSGVASDTVFYEWGERIYCIVWNLPEQKWLNGSSIADKVKPRMTNQSVGSSAGATSGGQTGNTNGLVMQVRAIKDYTCLKYDGNSSQYVELPDGEGKPVRRSYCLISIDIDGSRDRPPGPGPGWTLYIDIDKIPGMSGGSNLPPIRQTIPLAKLTPGKNGYDVVMINNQIREAPLGINNPLAIRDDGVLNDAGNGNVQIAWNYPNPSRTSAQAHLNGNAEWVSSTTGSTSQPYNFKRLPTPIICLDKVVHGTSSREAPLGIMDRSAMGASYRQIPRFRIEARDLTFRGDEGAIACDSGIPDVRYGYKFPWDFGIGSIDYPHIYTRHQSFQLISTDTDPATKASAMLSVVPDAVSHTHETALVRPDTCLVSVDVPRFQPANMTPDYPEASGGYSRTMVAYVDSNNSGGLDSGNTRNGRPTTWQEAYRTFRVSLKVPPDPKIIVDEQLIDIGRAPHGLGQNMGGPFAFSAYNNNPLIQQWFKPVTIRNAGNVNLYNIRLDQALGLLGDQASPSQVLPGAAITSSLDIAPHPSFSAFGAAPFMSGMNTWDTRDTFLGYTLSKPRVGDVDPTVMTVPDTRKWDNDFASRQAAQKAIAAAGWAPSPEEAKPLPVLVSVQVPLTQPVGTYQSWDPKYRMPYVSVFSDLSNKTANGFVGPVYGQDPMAAPSFQLKLGVRENQLTGGATPTTLPQIDFIDAGGGIGVAPAGQLPKYGDSTPAAYRDANNDVRLFYSSNRLESGPPTSNSELANFASAPWFIHEARLSYQKPSPTLAATWVPADPLHWWLSAQKMPSFGWGGTPPDLMKFELTGEPSVRHFSPSIGENLSLVAAANRNRTWMAWAGTADFLDSATQKVYQQSQIFYTDITPEASSGSTSGPMVFAIEHDPTQLKRYPSVVPDGNKMWMFWQGGNQGNWSIFYSTNNGGPSFDTTLSSWTPDQKLRTPDCLAAVGSPNPILRRYGADLRGSTGSGSADFTDPFTAEYNNAFKAFDVVYAGTNKITRNADILLSRYVAYGNSANSPSRTGQTLPRIYNEKLARDPKLGFYTSQHIAWSVLRSGATPQLDDWGNYNTLDLPYVHVVFPTAYTEGAVTLAAGTVISGTDGSVTNGANVIQAGTPIQPEVDASSGIYTYSYPTGSIADQILGKMIVDFSSGIIRFRYPFKETATTVNNVKVFSAPEVRADYTPRAWRITTDAAVDGSPRAFIERTSMTDPNDVPTRPRVTPGLDPSWPSSKPAPVDRMWVFWRKTGASIENSTIFYTTMRIGIDLTKLGLPPISMDPLTGTFTSGPGHSNLQITGALGPWEVDRTGTKIYFSEVDERYNSANFQGPGALHIEYDSSNSSGSTQHVTRDITDVSWITELPEQSLGFTMDANVNEGSIYAFADPQPQLSGTSAGVRSSKIWVFWTSTRGGNSDLYWQTLSPNFWAR